MLLHTRRTTQVRWRCAANIGCDQKRIQRADVDEARLACECREALECGGLTPLWISTRPPSGEEERSQAFWLAESRKGPPSTTPRLTHGKEKRRQAAAVQRLTPRSCDRIPLEALLNHSANITRATLRSSGELRYDARGSFLPCTEDRRGGLSHYPLRRSSGEPRYFSPRLPLAQFVRGVYHPRPTCVFLSRSQPESPDTSWVTSCAG